jgi:hypothetical protein
MRLTNRESDVLNACLQWLAFKRVFHWRQNNAPIPLKDGGFRKFVGMKGPPDILAIIPQDCEVVGHGPERFAVFCGIEVKMPGKKPRPEQRTFLDQLNAMGGIGIVVHSIDELERQLGPFLDARPRAAA